MTFTLRPLRAEVVVGLVCLVFNTSGLICRGGSSEDSDILQCSDATVDLPTEGLVIDATCPFIESLRYVEAMLGSLKGQAPSAFHGSTNHIVTIVVDSAMASAVATGSVTFSGRCSIRTAMSALVPFYGGRVLESPSAVIICKSGQREEAQLVAISGRAYYTASSNAVSSLRVVPDDAVAGYTVDLQRGGRYTCMLKVWRRVVVFRFGSEVYDSRAVDLTNLLATISWCVNEGDVVKTSCKGLRFGALNELDIEVPSVGRQR